MKYPSFFSSILMAVGLLVPLGCSSAGDAAFAGGDGGDGGHSIQNSSGGMSASSGSGGAGGAGGATSSASQGASSSTGSSSAGAGSGGGAGTEDCIELTTSDLTPSRVSEGVGASYYSAAFTPILNPSVGYFLEYLSVSDETGTFALADSPDDDFAGCQHCFRVRPRSYDIGDKQFFQASGSLTIESSTSAEGKIDATVTDLTLVEIHFADEHSAPTIVAGGQCLHVTSAKLIGAGPPAAPAGWTCDPSYFGDGGCDCGCGVIDNDCFTQTEAAACEYCYQCGGDSADGCGAISPADTTACIPL